jgi:endonuclease/exonuclease/phosphatase family metal-dependent hydrolase
MEALKIATWNIGGGIPGESWRLAEGPGGTDLAYYADIIEEHHPDILCLQEAHTYIDGRPDQTDMLANRLHPSYSHRINMPISISHLDSEAKLSLGIISRHPIVESHYEALPNPGLSAIGPNGKKWILYDKGFLTAVVNIAGTFMAIVNFHGFPFHFFGKTAEEPQFSQGFRAIAEGVRRYSRSMSVFVVGDFNAEALDALIPEAFEHGFREAFDLPTVPSGRKFDHILYPPDCRILDARVLPNESDHHYCEAKFELA